MGWYYNAVFAIGIFDAVILLIAGAVTAVLYLINKTPLALWDRIWPAVWILVGSTIGAGVILTATRYALPNI